MHLLVGLGNPGSKYATTRHNIGFWVLEEFAHIHNLKLQKKFQGQFAKAQVDNTPLGVLMPHTFMNESGRSVQAACTFFKIPPERVIVIHDDLDLSPLRLKIKLGGSDAGHNGLKSITRHLGTADYLRVRVGIGHPGDKNRVSDYVLHPFSTTEQPAFEKLADELAHVLPLIWQGEHAKAIEQLQPAPTR